MDYAEIAKVSGALIGNDLAQLLLVWAAGIQTFVVVAGGIFALIQLRIAAKARRNSVAVVMLDHVGNFEANTRRRYVYRQIVPRLDNPTDDDEAVLSQVANEFQVLGFLVSEKVIDPKFVLELYYGSVVRSWNAMKPWIMDRRRRQGTKYGDWFENLKDRSEKYILDNRPDEYPILVSRPDEPKS
jgi:Domain of unknown function (DUF4760)